MQETRRTYVYSRGITRGDMVDMRDRTYPPQDGMVTRHEHRQRPDGLWEVTVSRTKA